MKKILFMLILFVGSQSFAVSVCIVSGVFGFGTSLASVQVDCDNAPQATFALNSKDPMPGDYVKILKKLMDQGYKLTTQTAHSYTLVRDLTAN